MSNSEKSKRSHSPQLSFADLDRELISTTFVVVDLETTGGSHADSSITEIGAVKIRGGATIGEFQTLVNPGTPIPAFITVLTGITDAMVVTAPPIGEAFLSFLEFAGSSNETVLVAHNAPFDMGFLRAAAQKLDTQWPPYPVLDTARISRQVLTRDEVPNVKLATLANHFGAGVTPDHRALSDARATVDVFHGLLERLGSFGISSLLDLKNFSSRITDAQRSKRDLITGAPTSPGVYIFRDAQGEPLYIGKTGNLRSRLRTYFTSGETRRRIIEMIGLAQRVEWIETPTLIEAEVRELRLITALKPRFNRRSKFQEKAVWVKFTRESFPRLTSVRGHQSLSDDDGWCGPFSGREEAALAIDAIHELLPLRQCSPRITSRSIQSASPCALFDMHRCGAPCVGSESIDSYQTHVGRAQSLLHLNSSPLQARLNSVMQALALQERFEEASDIRNRALAFIRGVSRGQRIRSLTRIPELILSLHREYAYEILVIRHGRLCATAIVHQERLESIVDDLRLISEVVKDDGSILPAAHHEEVELLLRHLESSEVRILAIEGEWSMPTFGATRDRYDLQTRGVLEGNEDLLKLLNKN